MAKIKAKPPPSLEEAWANCHPAFHASIHALAAKYDMTWQAVYARWREYSRACFDQSALLSEFEEWNLKGK
jgi:hypothetical protein